MDKKILLLGGGGHCKSIIDSLYALNTYQSIGIVEKKSESSDAVMDVPVIGTDDELKDLFNSGYQYAFISLGSVGNPSIRIKLFNKIKQIGFTIPSIIDPSAVVSDYATLAEGVYVGKKAVINTGASIGQACIINTAAVVEHDCKIADFVHLAPGAVLSGDVIVGSQSHIGTNSTVIQQVEIGSNTIIGAGSVVTKNISEKVVAYGQPCREVSKR